MSELQIPEAAETALAVGNAHQAIRLTVAAELRRWADDLEQRAGAGQVLPDPDTLMVTAARLRARADELDGGLR